MLRSLHPKAGQFPCGPLMRAKKRCRLRSQTAGKELNLSFCRKPLKCFNKGAGGHWEVLVWDWRFLKQSSRAMAAKIYASSKGSETGAIFTIELKLRKTKHRKHHSFHSNAAASSWTRRTNCDIWNLHRSAPA